MELFDRTYQNQNYYTGAFKVDYAFWLGRMTHGYVVGTCHHGMARPPVADRGTASDKEGSCE